MKKNKKIEMMKELLIEDLKLINGGDQESYDAGRKFGYNFGRIIKAIGHIVDSLSPA